MNEEEFIKEHPSLKEKVVGNCVREYATRTYRVNINDIHKTQLDKAKVREAIDKWNISKNPNQILLNKIGFEKELGL